MAEGRTEGAETRTEDGPARGEGRRPAAMRGGGEGEPLLALCGECGAWWDAGWFNLHDCGTQKRINRERRRAELKPGTQAAG